jgi:diamine N-acetyltransferase
MNICLREVNRNNFIECLDLKIADDQYGFVRPNVYSIAQSKVSSHLIPLAIYNDEEMVGFTLHGRIPETGKYWIVRLMIDEKFQGRGFGKNATLMLINKMSEYKDCFEIFLSFVPRNKTAEKLYLDLGFDPTGETDEDGEIYMKYEVERQMTADI